MSNFTIEQLETLKEGTTPGPWERFHETWEEYNPDGDAVLEYEQYGIIGGADGILDTLPVKSLMDAPNQWAESGEHNNAANTRLAAAAPALVDTLIAEKQAHQETLHLVRELWSDVHHHGNVGRASILRHLTRILEADNG